MCLEFLRSLQRLISLETTNLGWSLEKYHWLPPALWFHLKVGAHSSWKGTIQMSYPSSHNRILNKFTSFSSLRWDHAGMHGLYCHPGIPRGIESQLPTALISSLIHSLLDTFLSLFYFSTLLPTFPRIISQISSLCSNPFWDLHLEETNVTHLWNEPVWKPRFQKPDLAKYKNGIIPSF